MKETKILSKAKSEVMQLFKAQLPTSFVYHNYNHTLEVVNAVIEIGEAMKLKESELEIVLLAAWFHDTGFIDGCENHEENSKKYIASFLKENKFSEEKTAKILGCIDATKMPQKPANKLEEVLCDADLYHLGIDGFIDRSNLLRVEWELNGQKTFTSQEWLETTSEFIESHSYFTDVAYAKLQNQKIKKTTSLKKE